MTAALAKYADRYIETRIDDEIVLMDLDSGNFFSLSGSAAAIWTLLDGIRSRDEVLAGLAQEYGCPATDIAPDVDDFLLQVRSAGFVGG